MTNEEFKIELEKSFIRSKQTLMRKEVEYSDGVDRLVQFKKTGTMESKAPTETLFTMMDKHFSSLSDMVKDPKQYSIKKWNEKIGDLRNYTFLLDALIRDLGVE
jgi:hypothetical protein